MGVSAYSIIASIVFYNLSLIVVAFLRRTGAIRAKFASGLLLFLSMLAALRLMLPLDLKFALVIRSYKLLPAIENALNTSLFGVITIGQLLLLIWGAGTLFFLLKDLRGELRFRRFEKTLSLYDSEQLARIADEFPGKFEVKCAPEITLPFTTGLFKPMIYLPDIELSDEEWRNIFRHETQHIRSLDVWKKLFFHLVRAVFWWNPLARLSENDIQLLIELQCDERVAGSGDAEMQNSYMSTILELMRHALEMRKPTLSNAMIGRESEIEIRAKALIAEETKRDRVLRRVLPPVMVALFLLSYLVILQPARIPNAEELAYIEDEYWTEDISPEVKGEGTYILVQDGEYHMYINGEYAFQLEEAYLESEDFNTIPILSEGDSK